MFGASAKMAITAIAPAQVEHEPELLTQVRLRLGPRPDEARLLHHIRAARGKVHWAVNSFLRESMSYAGDDTPAWLRIHPDNTCTTTATTGTAAATAAAGCSSGAQSRAAQQQQRPQQQQQEGGSAAPKLACSTIVLLPPPHDQQHRGDDGAGSHLEGAKEGRCRCGAQSEPAASTPCQRVSVMARCDGGGVAGRDSPHSAGQSPQQEHGAPLSPPPSATCGLDSSHQQGALAPSTPVPPLPTMSLDSLPLGVLEALVQHLEGDVKSVASLACACHTLHKVAMGDAVWRALFRHRWGQVVFPTHPGSAPINGASGPAALLRRRGMLHMGTSPFSGHAPSPSPSRVEGASPASGNAPPPSPTSPSMTLLPPPGVARGGLGSAGASSTTTTTAPASAAITASILPTPGGPQPQLPPAPAVSFTAMASPSAMLPPLGALQHHPQHHQQQQLPQQQQQPAGGGVGTPANAAASAAGPPTSRSATQAVAKVSWAQCYKVQASFERSRSCPCCGARDGKVVPLLFGFPSPLLLDHMMRGNLILGGDHLIEDCHCWACVECNASFRSYPYESPHLWTSEHQQQRDRAHRATRGAAGRGWGAGEAAAGGGGGGGGGASWSLQVGAGVNSGGTTLAHAGGGPAPPATMGAGASSVNGHGMGVVPGAGSGAAAASGLSQGGGGGGSAGAGGGGEGSNAVGGEGGAGGEGMDAATWAGMMGLPTYTYEL